APDHAVHLVLLAPYPRQEVGLVEFDAVEQALAAGPADQRAVRRQGVQIEVDAGAGDGPRVEVQTEDPVRRRDAAGEGDRDPAVAASELGQRALRQLAGRKTGEPLEKRPRPLFRR